MFAATVQLYKNAYGGIPKPVWWLALVMFINRSGTMVIPFLTVYLTSRGFTLSQAGLVMAAFGIGSIVGSYIGGRLTDRFGSFYIQVCSLFLNGILFIVLGQMKTLPQYAGCIFVLSGVGEAFRPANSVAVAAYSNEQNRIRCYALNRLAINLGWAIGPAVGGLLASYNYGLLFWADGLTCIAASLLLMLLLKPDTEPKTAKQEAAPSPTVSAYHDAVFLKGMSYLFLISLAFMQLFSVVPAYYKSEVRLNEATIGWVLAANGMLIAAFEMLLVYKLEKRRRTSINYIIIGAFLIATSFLLLDAGRTLTAVVASMMVVTVGEMFLFPFMNNFWVKRSGEANRGQYASVYTMVWAAATVLAPTLATQIASHAGFETLWVADFLLCAVGAVGFYFLKKELT